MAKKLGIFMLLVLFMLFTSVTISESRRWTTKITMMIESDIEDESSSGDETGDTLSDIEKSSDVEEDNGDIENGVPTNDCETNTPPGGCDWENQTGCDPHCECYKDDTVDPITKIPNPPFCNSLTDYMQVDE